MAHCVSLHYVSSYMLRGAPSILGVALVGTDGSKEHTYPELGACDQDGNRRSASIDAYAVQPCGEQNHSHRPPGSVGGCQSCRRSYGALLHYPVGDGLIVAPSPRGVHIDSRDIPVLFSLLHSHLPSVDRHASWGGGRLNRKPAVCRDFALNTQDHRCGVAACCHAHSNDGKDPLQSTVQQDGSRHISWQVPQCQYTIKAGELQFAYY